MAHRSDAVIAGIPGMSHLACVRNLHHPLNAKQLAAFREIASVFSGVPASLSNSSGVFLSPQFQFDMVRPGAALYGVNPTPEADNPMQPVVELKARIVQIRNIERGESVGYGGPGPRGGRPGWRWSRPAMPTAISAPAQQRRHPRRGGDGREQTLPGGGPHLDGPDGGRHHRSPA